ncbi:MAG: nicotinate-nucleotide--dimethylbenzimidazole phosphoribosyltransferase [Thermoanaerobacterales bacterium]|jgi:nicotinate-nucleotide--dimethylbenzimidazole phosphoribosyltransferase
MSWTHPTLHLPADLPVDAVAFSLNAVLEATAADDAAAAPDPDGGLLLPAAGVRRLADALRRAGVPAQLLLPRAQSNGHGHRHADGGAALADRLAAAGLGPDVLRPVPPDAEATEAVRGRTLVVTRCRETASGLSAAGHPVVVVDRRPPHHDVLAWLAARVGPFAAAATLVAPPDERAGAAARAHHLRLTKPPGSLGRLEDLGAQLAAIAGVSPPPVPRPVATAVFAGDHGVHAQGVSPWPQEVTAQMVANFLAGGAAINVLAGRTGDELVVVDVGVAGDVDVPAGPVGGGARASRLVSRKVRPGTADLSTGPAMSVEDARRALDVGAETALELVAGGARCLVTGDMGIANTTPAAALIACLTDRPASAVTGRGTGVDDQVLTRKTALVAAAVARARYQHGDDTLALLAEVGGLEHAALAGFIVAGAALQVPVVVDGVIAASALLVASRLVPGVERCVVAGHRSAEPGASVVLETLGLDPLLDLGMRLGEGTGAALAVPVVEAAARVLHEMATFEDAGVADAR